MEWTIFLVVSFIITLITVYAAITVSKGVNRVGSFITPLNTVFVGVFAAVYTLFLPIRIIEFAGQSFSWLKTVLITFYSVLQAFSLDGNFTDVSEAVLANAGEVSYIYLAYFAVLFFVAPMITFGYIISIFKNIFESVKYFFGYFRALYVFSELNDKSLALANDIKKNHPKALIVYANTIAGEDDKSFELISGAKKQKAVCLKLGMDRISLGMHGKKSEVHFFAIAEDETENTDAALSIIKRYGDRDNTNLYVFCTNTVGSLILSSPKEKKIKIRRVDEALSLINRELYENGHRFFENALDTQGGDKKIGAVVVGMGRYGTEMVKALSWFCQMDGYSVKITAFDKDPNAADKFTRVCPELMSPEINRVEKEGESRYDISVHYEEDVSTNKFYEKIRKLTDTTYVLVCLGNDELNIGTAIELRSCFAAMGLNPVIQAVVNNTALCEMLRGVTNFKNQDYNIEYIGDFMSSYTESVIISSELERAAISLHEKYGHAEDFWRYEYNYRSSMASAIHMKARIFCGIPGADKKESELTEEEAIIIENLEHRRWNAYMRSQGYSYSGSLDASSRNDLAKKHHNLVPFKRLSEEDKRKDRRVGTK